MLRRMRNETIKTPKGMLKYNFDRVFKARGINRPFSYLKNAGFTVNMAVNINRSKVARLHVKHLEQLCLLLRCTPNDFMAWEPENEEQAPKNHPLYQIKRNEDQVEITKMLNSIPLDKLGAIKKLIREELQNKD